VLAMLEEYELLGENAEQKDFDSISVRGRLKSN
jgi:hypothetical protein